MKNLIFKPKYDKLFWCIWIPTSILMLGVTAIGFFAPTSLFVLIPVDLFTFYFLVSPLFGYVELRESTLFVRFGFFITREIPYGKIRGLMKERRWYSESMLSLKSAMEHVNIKYNAFDVITVSMRDNDALIEAIEERVGKTD